MGRDRSKIIEQARLWLGCKESDGSHKKIIDVYNGHTPLARGYKVKYTDAWCATFVSAVAIACGYTDIIPTECGCYDMLELFKKMQCWVEADDYAASPGDIIFYDWHDSGKDDNTGVPDHVGIVEAVSGRVLTVIEGNYSNSVKRRYLSFDGKNIRGFGVPKYDVTSESVKMVSLHVPQLRRGSEGKPVNALQHLLIGYGYSCGFSGSDGIFGSDTQKAVKAFQKANGLTDDGVAGENTWGALLGV